MKSIAIRGGYSASFFRLKLYKREKCPILIMQHPLINNKQPHEQEHIMRINTTFDIATGRIYDAPQVIACTLVDYQHGEDGGIYTFSCADPARHMDFKVEFHNWLEEDVTVEAMRRHILDCYDKGDIIEA